MARKPKHEEHENHERWLISYADFITLLFAFFVVMYSVSSVNAGKYRVLSESLVAAFRAPAKSMTPIQIGTEAKSPSGVTFSIRKSPAVIKSFDRPLPSPSSPEDEKEKAANLKRASGTDETPQDATKAQAQDKAQTPTEAAVAIQTMGTEIENAMRDLIKSDLIAVRRGTFWLEVEINTSILYTSGNARLATDALPVLEELARILTPFPNALHVKGYTDDVPISTLAFPSNWELSAARAASVVTLFAKSGIKPSRLAALGFGEYWPVASNATTEGRAKNRRVVIVVLPSAEHREMAPGVDATTPQQLAGKLDTPSNAPEVAAKPAATPPAAAQTSAPVPSVTPAPKLARLPNGVTDMTKPDTTAAKNFAISASPNAVSPPAVPAPQPAAKTPPHAPDEPIDVTSKAQTDVGRFPIIEVPLAIPRPVTPKLNLPLPVARRSLAPSPQLVSPSSAPVAAPQ